MEEQVLEGHHGRRVVLDLCDSCQAVWFDVHESPGLTPGATLALFRRIGEQSARAPAGRPTSARCPRCASSLVRTHDMQRATRFEYLRCSKGHGRFITFFNFLREKDFIRPLTAPQIAELRRNVQTVNCSNCGAPIDLSVGTDCAHCGSSLSMLDMRQAEALVQQLREADDRTGRAVDPALPLDLARARAEVERAFAAFEHDDTWFTDVSSSGLVGAGLRALARWLGRA